MRKGKLLMGIIEGGNDAFIDLIHFAFNMYGLVVFVAICLKDSIANENDKMLVLAEGRTYIHYNEMIAAERKFPADEHMDFVKLVTPKFANFAPAILALENGHNVLIEEPIAFILDEAKHQKQNVAETLLLFMDTYSGYPKVKEANQIITSDKCDQISNIYVEYYHESLSRLSNRDGNPQTGRYFNIK